MMKFLHKGTSARPYNFFFFRNRPKRPILKKKKRPKRPLYSIAEKSDK